MDLVTKVLDHIKQLDLEKLPVQFKQELKIDQSAIEIHNLILLSKDDPEIVSFDVDIPLHQFTRVSISRYYGYPEYSSLLLYTSNASSWDYTSLHYTVVPIYPDDELIQHHKENDVYIKKLADTFYPKCQELVRTSPTEVWSYHKLNDLASTIDFFITNHQQRED